ncbi:uncharacterized protein [Dermacentor andersoni]|uniref:uncharacterized protein n=1 Tax=Dermacentor andersoni TaxID=34620 RepID=UPI003B3A069D
MADADSDEVESDEAFQEGAAFFGKRCLHVSDCSSRFIKGMTCNSDGDGEPGNCTCPDYTPLFLEEGGVYKCSRAGALGSSCERVEQCRYNNVYLLCLDGKCICPSPMRVKQGFKCMPEAKLGGNCSTIDSCYTRSSVCVGGICTCRIHYAQKGGSCVYVGDTHWKIVVAYLLPCIVVFVMFSIVLLAFCSVITQRYQDVLWSHSMRAEEQRVSLAVDPSNDPSSGVCSAALTDDRKHVESGGPVASTESSDNVTRPGVRFKQELASQQQLTDGGATDSSFRRRRHSSYSNDPSSPLHTTIDLNAELMAKLMASIERRLSSPPRKARAAIDVTPATPPASPADAMCPDGAARPDSGTVTPDGMKVAGASTIGAYSPRPIIKKTRSHSIPALLALDEQQRVRKVVRIGSQEISSTVTYVPYDNETALQETVEWPTLRDDVLQERFPNLAALSEASINDAMQAVAAAHEKKPEPKSEAKLVGLPVEEEVSGLGGEELMFGVGLTADFMDSSNPEESFRLPRLKADEMPLRFPQLAQLDQPAFREAK